MNSKDFVLLTLLFVAAFSIWTLPLQKNRMPFGEGDSAWHFANADPQYQQDRSTTKMPFFIGVWYYNISTLGPFAPEYPPPNHLNYALMQIAGGERILSPFLYIAITCFLGVFSTYFLIRKLYGTTAAFIAASGLIFSLREIMLYLWGQRPSMVSFVFIPIILYTLYQYLTSYYAQEHKPIYLYLFFLLVAAQFLLHIQGSVITFLSSAAFAIIMAIKYRRLPVSGKNLKHSIIAVIIFFAIIGPFIPIYYGLELGEASGEKAPISRLFSWTIGLDKFQGSYPPNYVQLSSHYSTLLLVMVFIGAVLLLVRRQNSDLLVLSWLIGVYIALHFDVFLGSTGPRIVRMMVTEPPVFFSLIAIGLMSLISMVIKNKNARAIGKIAAAIGFVVLILVTKAPAVKETLVTAYQGLGRITAEQYAATEWLMANVPEDAYIYNLGTLTFPKTRWMLALANRHVTQWYGKVWNETYLPGPQYFIMDYSDLAYLKDNPQYRQKINSMMDFEKHNFGNQTPIYNQNNIRIYLIQGVVEGKPA